MASGEFIISQPQRLIPDLCRISACKCHRENGITHGVILLRITLYLYSFLRQLVVSQGVPGPAGVGGSLRGGIHGQRTGERGNEDQQ